LHHDVNPTFYHYSFLLFGIPLCGVRAKLCWLASIFPLPDMPKIAAILGKVKRREKKNPAWIGRGFFSRSYEK
jgi:hypothetical protein